MIWQSESSLYNQTDFYKAFIKDLKNARARVIIESPFITTRRIDQLLPVLKKNSGSWCFSYRKYKTF